jgi:hypothetical protein
MHLMLSDAADVYTSARIEFGKTMLLAGDVETAKSQFLAAISYRGDVQLAEAYTYLGLSELLLKHCDDALRNFNTAKDIALSENNELILYESQVYRDCIGDTAKAEELYARYLKSQESSKTPLKQL